MTYPDAALCTVEDVNRQLNTAKSTDTNMTTAIQTIIDNQYENFVARMKVIIREVSAIIYQEAGNRAFVPYIDTAYYTLSDIAWDSDVRKYVLRTHRDLLSVTTLTNGDSSAVTAANYRLYPRNETPIHSVGLLNNLTWSQTNNDSEIVVEGVFGYHEDYANAWRQVASETIGGSLSASATSISVTDADSFERLQYLRLDDEFLLVTDLDTNANTITVERGVQGTTAATHSDGTIIEYYTPDRRASQACRRRSIVRFINSNENKELFMRPDGSMIEIGGQPIAPPPKRIRIGSV